MDKIEVVDELAERLMEAYLHVSDESFRPDADYTRDVAKALLFGVDDGTVFGHEVMIPSLSSILQV